jgi:cytochrome P450/nitrite reductase/ring-hydroxylating ferredoxin subunit
VKPTPDTSRVDTAGRNVSESRGQRWQRAARLEDLREDGPHALSAAGVDLVAVRTNGELRVFEGRCPHQGALLGEGELEGNALVCRNHRWRFDRITGQRIGEPQCLRTCPSRVEGDELLVDIASLAAKRDVRAKRTVADLPSPPGLPFFGHAFQMKPGELHSMLEHRAKTYGPIFRLEVTKKPIVIVTDNALFGPLLRDRPETFRRISAFESIFSELRVQGVFSAEGDEWRTQRKLVMEALAQRNVRDFYPTLASITDRLRKRWNRAADEGRELDVCDELKRFTVDVTTLLVFGHDLNTIEKGDEDIIQRHLEHIFPAIARRLTAIVPYWRYFKLPQDRKLESALVSIYDWLGQLLADTRAKLASERERLAAPTNFLEAMVAARNAEGKPFSDDVILANGLTMLLAGEDTTANSVAWAIHHLCDAPRAVDALRTEADSVLGEHHVPTDFDQVGRLVYANAVANETMRLRPVAATIFLEPTRDVVIDDVAVPKGTALILLTRTAATQHHNFTKPNEFMPDRWIHPGQGPHEPSTLLPFGSGPRICPGRSLALVEMRVVLSMIYRNFDIERVGRASDVRELFTFTMMPVGLRVRLRRRSSQPKSSS